MSLSLIVAVSINHVIGYQGKLPWHLPSDLRYFKRVTTGHPVVMGRNTFESIGKPLPGRVNYVLTSRPLGVTEVITVQDPTLILDLAQTQEVFVIGGASVYKLFLPHVTKAYVTQVHGEFEGDTFFELGEGWRLVSVTQGPTQPIPHTFEVYERLE